MSMREDIRTAINENLSQTIGEELRKRLDQADADATKVTELNRTIEYQTEEGMKKNDTIRAHERREGELAGRETVVTQREVEVAGRENAITKLELVAQYETEKRALTVDLFNTVFANRVMKETAFVSREKVITANDGQGYTTETREPVQQLEDKTTREE